MSEKVRVDTNDYEDCTPFAAHTPYIALDTIVMCETYQWKETVYEKGQSIVVGREVPQRFARVLVNDGFARIGRTLWENQEGYEYRVACIPGIDTIYIPNKSTTDFYSVPRLFWNIYPPTGVGRKAADVHDKLCQKDLPIRYKTTSGQVFECVHPVSSSDAAEIFLEAMEVAMVPRRERIFKYYAVKWFGPRFKACDASDET